MSYDPRRGFPAVVAELAYRDVGEALAWLVGAFGLVERLRWRAPGGAIGHGELEHDGGVLMLCAAAPGATPREGGRDGLCVRLQVVDVDGHCARARAAGATIVRLPQPDEEGVRFYEASDLDGHRWQFRARS